MMLHAKLPFHSTCSTLSELQARASMSRNIARTKGA